MTSESTKLIFVGLPSSGKSTFIAALWHVVMFEPLDGSLRLNKVEGNREYIEALHSSWIKCEPVSRTQGSSRQMITMGLKSVEAGPVITVVFPDLAGEIYDEQWRDRRWSQEYCNLVEGTTGVVLFLHAEHKYKPDMIADYASIIREDMPLDEEETAILPQYDPDKACKQVKMVELLQFHLAQLGQEHALRVAVVVSAWDLRQDINQIEGHDLTPEHFVEQEVPLLYQYLRANPEKVVSKVYGISAQGGDLETDKARLQDEIQHVNLIHVVSSDHISSDNFHDITEPLKWLMQ